jgi:hypothetical protein
MNAKERQMWKSRVQQRLEPYIRNEIATVERLLPLSLEETRAERLEEIRAGIKARAREYRKIIADPPDDEHFALYLEVFDDIVDDLKRVTLC